MASPNSSKWRSRIRQNGVPEFIKMALPNSPKLQFHLIVPEAGSPEILEHSLRYSLGAWRPFPSKWRAEFAKMAAPNSQKCPPRIRRNGRPEFVKMASPNSSQWRSHNRICAKWRTRFRQDCDPAFVKMRSPVSSK